MKTAYINCIEPGCGAYTVWLEQKKQEVPGIVVLDVMRDYGADKLRFFKDVFIDIPLPKKGDDKKFAKTLKTSYDFEKVLFVRMGKKVGEYIEEEV